MIHIEGMWNENYLTAKGRIIHERVHSLNNIEWIEGKLVSRGLRLQSSSLGLYGVADVVEFVPVKDIGIKLAGENGRFQVLPVEYKKGKPKTDDCDLMQMCAQSMCLEEMMGYEIHEGAIYYHDTRHREYVVICAELREKVANISREMHDDFANRTIHEAKYYTHCKACSLFELCQPKVSYDSASKYFIGTIDEMIKESE